MMVNIRQHSTGRRSGCPPAYLSVSKSALICWSACSPPCLWSAPQEVPLGCAAKHLQFGDSGYFPESSRMFTHDVWKRSQACLPARSQGDRLEIVVLSMVSLITSSSAHIRGTGKCLNGRVFPTFFALVNGLQAQRCRVLSLRYFRRYCFKDKFFLNN